MHPRALDVLYQTRNEHVRSVGDGVDVELESLEIRVDAHGALIVNGDGALDDPREVVRAVREVDGEATDDERRADDDRVPDALRDDERLFDARGHPAFRLRNSESVDEAGEAHALLGLVDSVKVQAAQRNAGRGEWLGEAQRRLTAELDERLRDVAVERLGTQHLEDAL